MTAQSSPECREVFALSPDPRVRVFRRALHGLAEFEGMEVDAYVVQGSSHVVILDTLLCPADMVNLMRAIEPEPGQKPLLCVNSHADWDHVWGNGYFQHTRPTLIIAHEHCRQRLLSSHAQDKLDDYKKYSTFAEVTVVPPTLTFREQFTIAVGGLSIELLHAPGHRRDQIVAWLPEISLLLGFDALEEPLPCVEDSSCVPLMLSTLQRLTTLNPQHVLCSHGSTGRPTLIQENLAYFQEIERRARIFLAEHPFTPDDMAQMATQIGCPFDEAIAHFAGKVDLTYYSWAHEHNVQSILAYLHTQA